MVHLVPDYIVCRYMDQSDMTKGLITFAVSVMATIRLHWGKELGIADKCFFQKYILHLEKHGKILAEQNKIFTA